MRLGCYAWIVRDGKVLLPRLAPVEPMAGKFTLPGGGIDHGEEPDACVVREVLEETGLHVKPKRILMALSWLPTADFHVVGIVYDVEIIGGELRFEEDGTTDYLEWFGLDSLSDVPKVELVQRVYERHLSGF